MISHIPRTSRIFIGLLVITLLLTYISLTLSLNINKYGHSDTYRETMMMFPQHPDRANSGTVEGWKQYEDPAFRLTFAYPPEWKIENDTDQAGNYIITLDLPDQPESFRIYIGKAFVGFNQATKKPYTINGLQGFVDKQNVIAIKTGEYYYTFDGSTTENYQTEFSTLMNSVQFK